MEIKQIYDLALSELYRQRDLLIEHYKDDLRKERLARTRKEISEIEKLKSEL